MLEINSFTSAPQSQLNIITKNISQSKDSFDNINSEFKDILNDISNVNNQNALSELIVAFEKQEKIVNKRPSISNITEYKKIISDIFTIASQNYKNSEIAIYSHEGFEKILNCSDMIDKKTDFIIKDFLENNHLSLKSLEYMEDIKGIILNLTI